MAVISVVMDNSGSGRVRRYKAPRNMMYQIFDIHASILTSVVQNVVVLPYLLEDEVDILPIAQAQDSLAIIPNNIAGTFFDYNFMLGEKTKFISMVRTLNSNFTCAIVIHFELIKASRSELILEWFRKGR